MSELGPWNNDDFETLSWHDVSVHGLRFDTYKIGSGSADLILDIDYLLKWDMSGASAIFTICRAELRFDDVFGLKMHIDYKTPTAGMCPFSIHGIERQLASAPTGHKSYHWNISVNWPSGNMEFEAPGFTQTLVASPVAQGEMWLARD